VAAEFHLLGEVRVCLEEQPVAVGHARQRYVLAVLALETNRPVAVDTLIERVWGEHRTPVHPASTVHTYVSLLRRALSPIPAVSILRGPAGYLLAVDEQVVDAHRFTRLVDRARATADDECAAGLIEQSLALWRGEPFAGLDTPWSSAVRATLVERRLAAQLDLTDIRLRLGRHSALLAELSELVEQHPLDERLTGQLMLALYRNGRQAAALAEYRRIWQRLADDVGSDVGPELGALHQRILAADPALVPRTTPVSPPARQHPLPQQLPASARSFVGRVRDLAQLDSAMNTSGGVAGALPIAMLSGTGGIGKTWLAMHWAHRNLDRYPDGQLYVNLRGFDPFHEPLPAGTALRGFLDALGVAPAAVSADVDGQTALYRSVLAGRRVLVVLDNARDTAQVVPLLPGDASCAVLVTSRNQLTGLVAEHDAVPMVLNVLPDDEARDVLAQRLGPQRIAAEPAALAELLARCGGLPLALGIVAARAAVRPDFFLLTLVRQIRDVVTRLSTFDSDDLTVDLRVVFACSRRALDEPVARVFDLLGLAPGPNVSVATVASLAAMPIARARDLLDRLAAAHLVQQHDPDHYQMHDLVYRYAAEESERTISGLDRAAALRRMVDSYLHSAYLGERALSPHRDPIDLGPPAAGSVVVPVGEPAAALAWFDRTHADLLAVHRVAIQRGWHATVWQLAWTLTTYQGHKGHLREHLAVWRAALTAAQRSDLPAVRALAYRMLGFSAVQLADVVTGVDHLHTALRMAEQVGDHRGQAHTHRYLAWAWGKRGDYNHGLAHATRAAEMFAALDDLAWHAVALNTVGWFHAQLGRYDQAHEYCLRALCGHREHRNREAEADTLDSLGYISHRIGAHDTAIGYYRRALVLYRDLGYSYQEANTLNALAEVHADAGQCDRAADTWRRALDLYRTQSRTTEIQCTRQRLATLPTESIL
jgi:DNA-binding SARP family transcriptional activator/tetratricopeptide (TPR) repeat protein